MSVKKTLKDLASSVVIVVAIALSGWLITGTWPFLVAVESRSMEPNLNVGDVVLLISVERNGGVVTWMEGKEKNYRSLGDYGDVIVYRDGRGKLIIHRVVAHVKKGDPIPILMDGKIVYTNVIARSSGYVTQGDNRYTNPISDQIAFGLEPIKEEWIVGVAKFRVPLIGYIRIVIPI